MVHGAMRLFTEFVRNDLSEDQLLPVMRELVPVLLTILGDSKVRLLAPKLVKLFMSLPAFNLHPCGFDCCLPSMSDFLVHGQRPTPSSCSGSHRIDYPCLVGGFQSVVGFGYLTRRERA